VLNDLVLLGYNELSPEHIGHRVYQGSLSERTINPVPDPRKGRTSGRHIAIYSDPGNIHT
jgi:hypothetical protein